MIPIVWKEFTCTASGSAFKVVECENCKARYVYQMFRAVQSQGNSLYLLDNEGAQNRAQSGAHAGLQKTLARDCDPVPCIQCGWYQANMVEKLRKERYLWLYYLGAGVLFVALFPAIGAWLTYMDWDSNPRLAVWLLGGAAACVSLGGGAMMGRSTLAEIWDPNDAPQTERLGIAQGRALSLEEFEKWAREQRIDLRDFGALG